MNSVFTTIIKVDKEKLYGSGNSDVASLVTSLNGLIRNHLNLTSITVKFAANFDFSAIGQSNNLKELHLDFNSVSGNSEGEWLTTLHQLNNLSKLRKLGVRNVGKRNGLIWSQFLKESASAETLESLTMSELTSNESFNDGLSRFYNLR